MRYVAPMFIFLIALPLVIIGAIFYMRRKAAVQPVPAQGNAPAFTQVPGTVAAVGGTVTGTASALADTAHSLSAIVQQFVPDDSHYTAEPSLPATTPQYDWNTSGQNPYEWSQPAGFDLGNTSTGPSQAPIALA